MLHLRTFGGLSVAVHGAAGTGAAQQRKTLALLALLATSGRSGISRDRLMAYLWPEADEEHARALLKQACYALRRDLREHDLFLGATELSLNPAVITSDIQAFDDALHRGDPAGAVEAYAGPFLDGFHLNGTGEFEEWIERERARRVLRVEGALETLATESANRGDHRAAARWWRRLAELNPLSERAAVGLMAALEAMDQPVEAIRYGLSHAALVRSRLGVEPGADVSALIRRLQDRASGRNGSPPGSDRQRSTVEAAPRRGPGPSAVPSRVGRRLPAGTRWLGLALSLAAIAGASLFWRSRRHVHLDSHLVAVAPFEVLPPDLEPWREGFMRVLSGYLDAAGLRVVAPAAVVRAWPGRATTDAALALGGRTGARLVVYGQLLGAGRDSVRLSATLLDAEADRSLAVISFRDAANHVDRLSDSLVAAILHQVGPIGPTAGSPADWAGSSHTIAGPVFGPDGHRPICDYLPQGSLVTARLLNPSPPPRQGGFGAFACPESQLRLSVPAPGAWDLRVTLPASPSLGRLPLNHLEATPYANDAGEVTHRVVVAEGTAMGGQATLDGKPVQGVLFTLAYQTHGTVATNGASGPDGHWVEFFGRSPPVLQNGVRYVAGPACMFLGARLVGDLPARGFLFPSELTSIDCAMVTAPAIRFTHDRTRLVVTPMPADIGGLGDAFVHEYGYGWGVQFPVAAGQTPSHAPDASHLFSGGLIIGLEPDRVLTGTNMRGEAECGRACQDLGLDGNVRVATLPGLGKQVTWQYSDAASPDGVGLRITQLSIDGVPPADYVLFRFTLTNAGASPITFHAGFFGDWDIGDNRDDDVGFTAMDGRLMYQTDIDRTGPYLGTLLAGDAPISGNYFFRKVAYPSIRGQLDALAGRRSRPTSDAPGDNRYIHAAGPFRLDHDRSAELWIAVVAGETRSQLLANASEAAGDIANRRRSPSGNR